MSGQHTHQQDSEENDSARRGKTKVLWIGDAAPSFSPLGEVLDWNQAASGTADDPVLPSITSLFNSQKVEVVVSPLPSFTGNPHTRIRHFLKVFAVSVSLFLVGWLGWHWAAFSANLHIWVPALSVISWLATRVFKSIGQNEVTWTVTTAMESAASAIIANRPDVVAGWSFGGAVGAFLIGGRLWEGRTLLLAPSMSTVTRVSHGGDFGVPEHVPTQRNTVVLVVHSKDDGLVPFSQSEMFVERHQDRMAVELVALEKGGHLCMDASDKSGGTIRDWLRQLEKMKPLGVTRPAGGDDDDDEGSQRPKATDGAGGKAEDEAPQPLHPVSLDTNTGSHPTVRRRRRRAS